MDSSGSFELDSVRPWQVRWETADEFNKWLRVGGGLVYCLYCRATKQHNVFNIGIPITDSWDKTKLNQHCRKACKKHTDALEGYQATTKMATNLKSSRKRKLDSMKDSLMVIVQCVFWLSYECIASCKLRSLYKFVRKLPGMPKLQSVNDLTYANAARAREFTMSLSSILKGYLWKDLLDSPFVSVLIDESTDISTSENMIIYFIYLKAGVAVVTYAAMLHVPAVDAASITDTLLVFFAQNGLDTRKITCFCSDGASVMTGVNTGVAARLKWHNPSCHCIAHRLALCCSDAADDVDYPSNAEVTINEVSAYFNRSGKKTVALDELAKEYKISQTKVVKSGKTRWLSREGAVRVMYQMLFILVQLFTKDSKDNDVAASILPMMTSFMFIATLATMVDLLKLMATLSKSFQFDNTDYATVQSRLHQTRSAIISRFLQPAPGSTPVHADMIEGKWDQEWNALLEDDNPNASDKFESPRGRNVLEFLQSCACSFLEVTDAVYKCQFRGFTVHQMCGDSKKFKDWVVKFALALMSRLAKRFPQDDMAIMAAMEIFNPDRCAAKVSSEADLATYGEAELELLIKHYGEAKCLSR